MPLETIRRYREAKTDLLKGKGAGCDPARALLERHGETGYYPEGEFRNWYIAGLLRGLVYEICEKNYGKAMEEYGRELEMGLVSLSPEDLSLLNERRRFIASLDYTPPKIQDVSVKVLDITWKKNPSGGDYEEAEIEVSGQADDDKAMGSVLVMNSVADSTPDPHSPRSVKFQRRFSMRVTEPLTPIQIEARDASQNPTVEHLDHVRELPPLHISDAKETYALVIGVDSYDSSYRSSDGGCLEQFRRACNKDATFYCYSLPGLSAAAADATRFHDLLIRRGVPPQNIRLLVSRLDEPRGPTRQQVMGELLQMTRHSGRRFFFYFAGHGTYSKKKGDLLILWDTRAMECKPNTTAYSSELESTALASKDIEKALNESSFEERYLIMDACRTPSGSRGIRSAPVVSERPENVLRAFASRGVGESPVPEPKAGYTLIFYPTIDGKVSLEWSRKQAGFFTYYLVQGLRRDLSIYELSQYLSANVESQSAVQNCPDGKISEDCTLIQRPYISLPERLQPVATQKRLYVLGRPEKADPD